MIIFLEMLTSLNLYYPFWNFSGTKSEVLDIDNPDLAKYPLFSKARRYECSLKAGDVLFIPGKISRLHSFAVYKICTLSLIHYMIFF